MSEENKDLGDDLKDKANKAAKEVKDAAENVGDKAKEVAKEAKEVVSDAAETVKEKTSDAASEVKETAQDIKEEVKDAASDFKEGWNEATNNGENKKLMAGILAIILGAFGIHKFILGYNKEGIILLVASLIGVVTTCIIIGSFVLMATGIVGLIEGIIYLTKSDEEFYNTYQVGKKPWF